MAEKRPRKNLDYKKLSEIGMEEAEQKNEGVASVLSPLNSEVENSDGDDEESVLMKKELDELEKEEEQLRMTNRRSELRKRLEEKRRTVQNLKDIQLKELRKDLKLSNKLAYAEGSRKNLKTQWEVFLLFCTYFEFTSLPVTTETLQLYAQFLSRSFKSVDSIRNYISGVKTMHYLLGHKLEEINLFLLNLSLKGLAKQKMHCIVRAEPITPHILQQIFNSLSKTSANDMAYWCLFVFAFFLLARKSNLVPTTTNDLRKPKFLMSNDVRQVENMLIVDLKWTKTIQSGERVLRIPLKEINNSDLCPVSAYRRMLQLIPRMGDKPLFMLKSGKPIMYNLYMHKLRDVLDKIGLNKMAYSTHSFRRGMATYAFRLGLSADVIQLMGDWHSDAYKAYLEYDMSDKCKIFDILSKNISSHQV